MACWKEVIRQWEGGGVKIIYRRGTSNNGMWYRARAEEYDIKRNGSCAASMARNVAWARTGRMAYTRRRGTRTHAHDKKENGNELNVLTPSARTSWHFPTNDAGVFPPLARADAKLDGRGDATLRTDTGDLLNVDNSTPKRDADELAT